MHNNNLTLLMLRLPSLKDKRKLADYQLPTEMEKKETIRSLFTYLCYLALVFD